MSSTRTMNDPPCERAESQDTSAHAADPRCRSPVGEGAKRPRYLEPPIKASALLDRHEARRVLSPDLQQNRLARRGRSESLRHLRRAGNRGAIDLEDDVSRFERSVGRATGNHPLDDDTLPGHI